MRDGRWLGVVNTIQQNFHSKNCRGNNATDNDKELLFIVYIKSMW